MTARHKALVKLLRGERVARQLLQGEIARRLGEQQSYVSRLESGQRRIDVVEFIRIAHAIGCNPVTLFRKVVRTPENDAPGRR